MKLVLFTLKGLKVKVCGFRVKFVKVCCRKNINMYKSK